MESIYVPQLLDTSERFFIFYLYEIASFVSLLFLGAFLKLHILGFGLGIFSFFVCRHLRVKGYISKIIPSIYWYTPAEISKIILKLESTPSSANRLYVG